MPYAKVKKENKVVVKLTHRPKVGACEAAFSAEQDCHIKVDKQASVTHSRL